MIKQNENQKKEVIPVDETITKQEGTKRSKRMLARLPIIVSLVLSVIFGIIAIFSSILIIKDLTNSDRPPSIFGYTPAVMGDDCMQSDREDQISYGEFVLLKKTEDVYPRVGDVISFHEEGALYIGRVETRQEGEGGFTCTVRADRIAAPYPYSVTDDNYIGTVHWQNKALGTLALFILTPLGSFLLIWLPALTTLGLIVYEWLRMRKAWDEQKNQTEDPISETESITGKESTV